MLVQSTEHLAEPAGRLVIVSVTVQAVILSFAERPALPLPSLSLFVHSPSGQQRRGDKRSPAPAIVSTSRGRSAPSSPPSLLLISPQHCRFPEKGMDLRRAKACGTVKRNSWLGTETHTHPDSDIIHTLPHLHFSCFPLTHTNTSESCSLTCPPVHACARKHT